MTYYVFETSFELWAHTREQTDRRTDEALDTTALDTALLEWVSEYAVRAYTTLDSAIS